MGTLKVTGGVPDYWGGGVRLHDRGPVPCVMRGNMCAPVYALGICPSPGIRVFGIDIACFISRLR